jgi:two-component system torCAD operon response regulator TorR
MEAEIGSSVTNRATIKKTDDPLQIKSVLLLESDPRLRQVLAISLNLLGVEVLSAPTANKAQEILKNQPVDLFVLAFTNPASEYGDLIERFRKKSTKLQNPFLVLTTQRLDDSWRNRYKPDAVIYKPFDIRFFIRRIKDLLYSEQVSDDL